MAALNNTKNNKVALARDEKIPSSFLTRAEAAAYLKMKPESLSNLHSIGKGPTYYKKMGRVYYLEEDLVKWILEGKIPAGQRPPPRVDPERKERDAAGT